MRAKKMNTIETYWVCACDTCGDMMEVARPRKVCPFDNPPFVIHIDGYEDVAECNVYNYQRQECTVCGWSDDYAGYTTCPENCAVYYNCEVSE